MIMDIRSCRPDELERLIPLLDEEFIFGKGRTISLRLRFRTVFCRNNLHNILICTDGELIASALAMRQFDWREGDEIFRGAMIGAVYTHPARRGEGWASRLLGAAAMQLREQSIDFGVLWTGQPSFYARLGWVAADCSVLGEFEQNESTLNCSLAGAAQKKTVNCRSGFNPTHRAKARPTPESVLMPEPSGEATLLPVEASAPRLEDIRQSWLNATTLRRPEDYRQLPLPAEDVNVLWREDQGKAAYALLGSNGATGFLYELVGDDNCFPALWREACRNRRRIFVNDRADSPSCRWLTDHTGVRWKNKSLAMWLPLSKRVDMPRLGQWHIPYFDRI